MTPEQQRIAIAESCGWKVLEPEVKPAIIYLWGLREGFIHEENREIIPDYLNDLNAMHEAEKFIKGTDLYINYVNYLFRSVGLNRIYYMGSPPEVFPADRQFAVFHATASQRAEAFLRTIGKWEECK